MRGAYFVLKTTGVQKCDETNERGDNSISIGGVDDEPEQKGLEARHVRWRQSTRKLRKDDLQTIQGVRRKNLLDTMLFFSIKDPQDPPSLPLLPN